MMKRLLLLLGAVSLVGCLDTTGPNASNPATETFASSLGVNISQMSVTQNGTYFIDSVVGTGTQITNPQTTTNVNVDYVGYLADGTIFDAGSTSFALGDVIVGFVDGMVGMKVGGTRLIVIPSDLGYGNTTNTTPRGVTIKPNSTLVFKIKLNSVTG